MDPRDQIKDKLDLAELIGEYVQVKHVGTTVKALCPFHNEKTASLNISPDKGVWHCFGCGEGGDCFTFVMKMEGMDFSEALRHLGKKAGVEVQRFPSKETNERQRLIGLHELASRFYRKVLVDLPQAKAARDYLSKRGIDSALQEKFGIGFSPDSWDALATFLSKKGYRDGEAEKAGLLMRKKSGQGMIDRFRGRVMIPLRDRHGNIVGFTARIMPGADEKAGPKYMNTPETPAYHKGKLLFGLDLAKQAIKQKGHVIVVEGNLDVVASHKAGVENIVASSGTALTEDQLSLLKRYTDKIVFCFDQDAAGFQAAQKGIRLGAGLGFDVRALVIPEEAGKDPDDVVQKDPALWRDIVEHSVPIMQFYIDRAKRGKDFSHIDDKRAVGKFLLPELAQVQDVVEREHWLQVISDLLRTDIHVLRQSISKTSRTYPQAQKKLNTSSRQLPKSSKEEQVASLLMGLMVHDELVRADVQGQLAEESLPTPELKKLYSAIKMTYDSPRLSVQKSFFRQLRESLEDQADSPLVPLLDRISIQAEQFISTVPAKTVLNHTHQLLHTLVSGRQLERKQAIVAELRQAESAGDAETATRLLQEFNELH